MTNSIRSDFTETDFNEVKARITWNAIIEPGDRSAGQLIAEHGSIGALDAFLNRTDFGPEYLSAYERWNPRYHSELANERIALAKKHDLKLLVPTDELWPAALRDLEAHEPILFWYRGDPAHFRRLEKSIGVVGSRNSSHYGQRVTSDLATVLVDENAAVVSGGALGIDSVAHRTTLALGGVTAAFMAGSLDLPYPAANYSLFDQIAHTGLLLSEMSPGSNPTRWRFLQRNRLIAAVTNALVVTEAGLRSGSINTVNHATELERPIFAVPGPITSPSSAGCNRLIRDQMANLLVEVSDLPLELNWRKSIVETSHSLGSLELRAFDALGFKAQSFEQLVVATGLSVGELRIALGGLQLAGVAKCVENRHWSRNNVM
mgnify:FL=1